MKNIQKIFSRNNNKDVVRGKMIAASIMLESIFSILGAWSPDNLRNFLSQLTQFYVVTSHPWVCDGREMPWTELDFGTQQVIRFLLTDTRKQPLSF